MATSLVRLSQGPSVLCPTLCWCFALVVSSRNFPLFFPTSKSSLPLPVYCPHPACPDSITKTLVLSLTTTPHERPGDGRLKAGAICARVRLPTALCARGAMPPAAVLQNSSKAPLLHSRSFKKASDIFGLINKCCKIDCHKILERLKPEVWKPIRLSISNENIHCPIRGEAFAWPINTRAKASADRSPSQEGLEEISTVFIAN